MVAEDADSRLNGAVMYSIIRGDQGNQFVIDSVSGLLKVNKPLDRETVSKGSHSHEGPRVAQPRVLQSRSKSPVRFQ